MIDQEIIRQRLKNQRLTPNQFEKPEQVVAWLGAVQAQDYHGALWALGLRLRGSTQPAVEVAFQEGRILRTHVLRPTWHFVTPQDIRWMLALTAPRVHKLNDSTYRIQGIDSEVYKRSRKIIVKALQGENQLTRDELASLLESSGIKIDNGLRLAYIIMRAELDGIICSGPRRGKQFTYMLLDERAPASNTLTKSEALAELAARYFTSRGPASVKDFAGWSGLSMADARTALEAVNNKLESEEINGQTCWFPQTRTRGLPKSPFVYLLSIYDEYISGYKNRTAMDAGFSMQLFAMGNALQFIIVMDGLVVGTWKRTIKKDAVLIELNYFKKLSRPEKLAVVNAANRYGEFLGLPVVLSGV